MNNINEDQFAKRLQQYLNAGINLLDSNVNAHLFKARRLAVDRHVAINGNIGRNHSALTLVATSQWAKLTLAIAALSIGISATYYWQLSEESLENELIDSSLLADDVPPNAYIDPGFRKWLERASPSSAL